MVMQRMKTKIKWPEENLNGPVDMFRTAVENSVNPNNPKADIENLNTDAQVKKSLMMMNQRKNDLIREHD